MSRLWGHSRVLALMQPWRWAGWKMRATPQLLQPPTSVIDRARESEKFIQPDGNDRGDYAVIGCQRERSVVEQAQSLGSGHDHAIRRNTCKMIGCCPRTFF